MDVEPKLSREKESPEEVDKADRVDVRSTVSIPSQEQVSAHQLEAGQSNQETPDSESHLVRETWKKPWQNRLKLIAAYYGFVVFGMNDSLLGVLVPDLETHYELSYMIVSLCFLVSFSGYLLASLISDIAHRRLGRWGVSVLGTSLQLACYIIACFAPPFPVLVVAYGIAGTGNGLIEACWNSWCGGLRNSNEILGLLHANYGLGGVICPSIATAFLASGKRWNYFYFVMIGFSVLSVTASFVGFYKDVPSNYLRDIGHSTENSLRGVLRSKLVWLLSTVLFLYVGAEISLAGWITTFMIVVRNGAKNKMGYVTTGYWVGLTLGRVVLGFVTGYVKHEEISIAAYLSLSLVFILLFWLVPSLIVSAISAAFIGFWIGPLFPTVIVVALKKLPKKLHVSGVSFAAALGGTGAAIMPFIDGVISDRYGPKILGPFSFSLLGAMLVIWFAVIKWF